MITKASSTLIDVIIDHPTVRRRAQQGGERLASAGLLDQGAVAYADDKGRLLLFVSQGGDIWEGHVFSIQWGNSFGTGTFSQGVGNYSGAWSSTSTITSVVVFPLTGNFVNNTVVSLYGRT